MTKAISFRKTQSDQPFRKTNISYPMILIGMCLEVCNFTERGSDAAVFLQMLRNLLTHVFTRKSAVRSACSVKHIPKFRSVSSHLMFDTTSLEINDLSLPVTCFLKIVLKRLHFFHCISFCQPLQHIEIVVTVALNTYVGTARE